MKNERILGSFAAAQKSASKIVEDLSRTGITVLTVEARASQNFHNIQIWVPMADIDACADLLGIKTPVPELDRPAGMKEAKKTLVTETGHRIKVMVYASKQVGLYGS